MKCPIDQTELVMSERQGVEIDYCPTCRGVWLDRGELDKIIERTVPPLAQPEPQQAVASAPSPQEWREPHRGEARVWREPHGSDSQVWREPYREKDERKREKAYRQKRRKSFLEEIFDFD